MEGLNTTMDNLDASLEESAYFGNEIIKKSSRDNESLTDYNKTIESKFKYDEDNNNSISH